MVALLYQEEAADTANEVALAIGAEGLRVAQYQLAPGEAAKTLEEAGRTYEWLNETGMTRADSVVVVGGGAATDAGGFIAATYLRGVEVVYFPTTLLAAVDAAIGGKTAVNVGGKNLVGVFAQPASVIVDVDVLDALPLQLRVEGMAEVLKAGMVGDQRLVERLERDGLEADTEYIVRSAVAVKMALVSQDPLEKGVRSFLNYGHTVGHAIELIANIGHGPAVAVGMEVAAEISKATLGFPHSGRQSEVIEQLGLPTTASFDVDEVMSLVRMDKKRDSSGLRMVLLSDIAVPALVPVAENDVRSAVEAVSG